MDDLLQHICRLYDFDKIRVVRHVAEGYLSQNYIIACDTTRYFLKKYRYTDAARITEIHHAKQFFADGGIPIILPLHTVDDRSFFAHDGTFWALFPFIEGRILRRAKRTPQAFATAGEMLARMHLLSTTGPLPLIQEQENEWNADDFYTNAEKIEHVIDAKQPKDDFDALALRTINLKRHQARSNTLQFSDFALANDHLVHGDYHGANIFYDGNDTVQSVFDLEKSRLAPRSIELARTLEYMCLAQNYTPQGFASARALLSGYQAVYPIERQELQRGMHALFLGLVHSLWIETEHYIHDNSRVDTFLTSKYEHIQHYATQLDTTIDAVTYKTLL